MLIAFVPQCDGIHSRITLLHSNMLYSLRLSLLLVKLLFGRHGWTRISTFHGFNSVVVVGLLQVVVVLINEAFPFDSMFVI